MNENERIQREAFFRVFESDILPGKMPEADYRALRRAGVKFKEGVVGDPTLTAILPDNWEKRTTGPSWVTIHDEHGVERAEYFFKTAWYDTRGFTRVMKRYSTYMGRPDITEWCVWDAEKGVVLFEPTGDSENEKREAAIDWLNEHFPNWEDPAAYWSNMPEIRWWEFWKRW